MERKINYPDPLAPFDEKISIPYGLSLAKIIAEDWFKGGMIASGCAFMNRRDYVRAKRKFVRGEVDLAEFKNLFNKGDNDLNYLNLDWRYINLGEKFSKIVCNGIGDENYRLNIRATDKLSVSMKKERENEHIRNIASKKLYQNAKDVLNLDLMPKGFVPEDEEEMRMLMEIKDRPKVEIGEEILIDYILKSNDWDIIELEKNKDLVNIGLICARVYIDKNDGIKVKYVDPENYVHSSVRRNDFSDKFYEGVVDTITISDLARESEFEDKDLRKIAKMYGTNSANHSTRDYDTCTMDELVNIKVDVLRFAYKTNKVIKYKQKLRNGKPVKAIKKPDDYKTPDRSDAREVSGSFDTWMEGNYVVGSEFIYGYRECENLYDDVMNKAMSPFITMAYDIYENKLRSFTDNIEPLAKRMQITALKIQQLISELKPDIIEIDFDMLAELDEGKGGVQKKIEMAMSLLNVKGIVFSKRVNMGEDGIKDKAAVRPGSQQQGSAIAVLLNSWAHDYNLIRENTGINTARDGSITPDTLVGVNQMAQLASNTVTADIVKTAVLFKKKICETISTRIHSIYQYKEAKKIREIYTNVLGKHLYDALEVMKNRHLHEFGFIPEMKPTQEKQKEFKELLMLGSKEGSVNPEVMSKAIDIYETNPKLAHEYLLYQRRKQIRLANETEMMKAREKSKNDALAAQSKVQAELQSYKAKKQIDLMYEGQLAKIELMKTQGLNEVNLPKDQREFTQDVYLKQIEAQVNIGKHKFMEDRKDEREKLRATQNSKMIKQREVNSDPIDFENEDFNLQEILNQQN
jgi:hypothetical protein